MNLGTGSPAFPVHAENARVWHLWNILSCAAYLTSAAREHGPFHVPTEFELVGGLLQTV